MTLFQRATVSFFAFLLTSCMVTTGAFCACSIWNADDLVNDCSEFCTIEDDSIVCITTTELAWNMPGSTLISGCTSVTCRGGACQNTKIDVGIETSVTCVTGACQNAEIVVGATSAVVCEGDALCTSDPCQSDTCRNATIAAGVDSEISCKGDACEGANLEASSNGVITCQGSTPCQMTNIVAGVDTEIFCIGNSSSPDNGTCWDASIIADASCGIKCHGVSTCQGIRLTSGVDSVVECLGENACLDSFITMGPGSQLTCKDGAQCDNQGTVEFETIPQATPTSSPSMAQTALELSTTSPATLPTSTPSEMTVDAPVSLPGKTASQTVSTTTPPTADSLVPVASSSKCSKAFVLRLPMVVVTVYLFDVINGLI